MALTGNVYGSQSVAKAWVNFDGTGTAAIQDSFNVTSLTDNGTGDYTINFTNALSNANGGVSVSADIDNIISTKAQLGISYSALSTTSVDVMTTRINETATTNEDCQSVSLTIFGD